MTEIDKTSSAVPKSREASLGGETTLKQWAMFFGGILLASLYFNKELIIAGHINVLESAVELAVDGLESLYNYLEVVRVKVEGGIPRLLFDDAGGPKGPIDDLAAHYTRFGCPRSTYSVKVVSRDPYVAYIEGFLTDNEIAHIIKVGEPKFARSTVVGDDGSIVSDYRTSFSAFLDKTQDIVIGCVERRAADFQGIVSPKNVEPLQLVRYHNGQQYQPHFDWFSTEDEPNKKELKRGGQRTSSFFVYLIANCTLGETSFVNLQLAPEVLARYCDIITCDPADTRRGTKFIPIIGNAIFWFNIKRDLDAEGLGIGDKGTFHAGLPVGEGEKLAMNSTYLESFQFLDN